MNQTRENKTCKLQPGFPSTEDLALKAGDVNQAYRRKYVMNNK